MQIFLGSADYIILGFILLSVFVSLMRGFVREAVSLVTWLAAIWLVLHFTSISAEMLTAYVKSATGRYLVAGGVLFLTTLIVGALINYMIGQLVDKTGLSGTDRLLGALFGAARGILLVGVLLLVARLTPMPQEEWWKNSLLIPYFEPMETWLHGLLPESMSSKFELAPNP